MSSDQTGAIGMALLEKYLAFSMGWIFRQALSYGLPTSRSTRACPQLSQMTLAARWIAPRKCTARLSYRVAMARNCLSLAKKFSIR